MPRVNDGKELKYETPFWQPNMIDFPPGVAERLKDRDTPIWITEGVKKADAGCCAGLAIVGLTGVWNWLRDGAALPDFRELVLKDREVILCFDSDTAVKPEVRKALKEIGGWLKISRHADVKYCCLPHNGDSKTGLDDYLAAGHTVDDLLQLVQPDLPALAGTASLAPLASITPRDSLNGAELLHAVLAFLARFVAYPSKAAQIAHALWIAHSWFMESWESTPRIAFLSPEPGSGKAGRSRSPSHSSPVPCVQSTRPRRTCSARSPTKPDSRRSSMTRSTPCLVRRPKTTRTFAAC
jgi:Domain of unknown function (DUF3854)